jgi:hypothetical protein
LRSQSRRSHSRRTARLSDPLELLEGTKPLDQDSDDDGLVDAGELNILKTQPVKHQH